MTANKINATAAAQKWAVEWTITGGVDAPANNTYSDGYKVTCKFTTSSEALAKAKHHSYCVQYLDADGKAVVNTDTAQGAPFLCANVQADAGTAGNQTTAALKTYSHAEMACAGAAGASPACTGKPNGGAALDAGAVETWPAGNGAVASIWGAAKSVTVHWIQPKDSGDYAGKLRRYSAADKVRGWATTAVATGNVGNVYTNTIMGTAGSTLSLVGASTLAAGVALGAAALAF